MSESLRARRTREYKERCRAVNAAYVAYRAILKAFTGSHFSNIEYRSKTGKMTLQAAAKDWAEGVWNE